MLRPSSIPGALGLRIGAFDSARTEGKVLGSTPSSTTLVDSGLASELLVSAMVCTVAAGASPEVCWIGVEGRATKVGGLVWDGANGGGWGFLAGVWLTASRSLPSGVYSVVKCTGCIGATGAAGAVGAGGAGRLDQSLEYDTQEGNI